MNSHHALSHALERLRQQQTTPRARILFMPTRTRPGRVLAFRGAVVVGLFLLVLAVFYLDRDGLRDHADGHVTFSDVVYFTMVTVTTVGYGDIVPVSRKARLIDALLVTPVRIFVWLIFLGTAYELVLQQVLENWRMRRLQQRLSGHVVLCGFGNSGGIAAAELVARGGHPEQMVVIDTSPERVRVAADLGYVALHGDATGEDLLRVAGVERARAVVVAVGRDDTTALVVLTIRGLGAQARVAVTAREQENVKLLRNCGADEIVAVWRFGGSLLANAVSDQGTVGLVQDLLSRHGEVMLRERPVLTTEVGRRLRELTGSVAMGIDRGDRRYMFWEADGLRLEPGDRLIVIDGPDAIGDLSP